MRKAGACQRFKAKRTPQNGVQAGLSGRLEASSPGKSGRPRPRRRFFECSRQVLLLFLRLLNSLCRRSGKVSWKWQKPPPNPLGGGPRSQAHLIDVNDILHAEGDEGPVEPAVPGLPGHFREVLRADAQLRQRGGEAPWRGWQNGESRWTQKNWMP